LRSSALVVVNTTSASRRVGRRIIFILVALNVVFELLFPCFVCRWIIWAHHGDCTCTQCFTSRSLIFELVEEVGTMSMSMSMRTVRDFHVKDFRRENY
jgi:hypothetical protein